jgi:hypothetical protein
MITFDHTIAIGGAAGLGQEVVPSTFTPSCDAYASAGRSTTFQAAGVGNATDKFVDLKFSTAGGRGSPYTLAFFRNVTNQPMFFVAGGQCDLMVRYWDTAVSSGSFEPRMVRGDVKANLSPMGRVEENGVYGVQVDTAFVEYPPLDCGLLAGYDGSGLPPVQPHSSMMERRSRRVYWL